MREIGRNLEGEIVDRDNTIDELRQRIADRDNTITLHNAEIMEKDLLIESLQNQLDEEREANRWIPVGERLPAEGIEVQVMRQYESGSRVVDTDQIESNDWLYSDSDSVTHWKRIPQLLQEQK